jgi:hypothetical protein
MGHRVYQHFEALRGFQCPGAAASEGTRLKAAVLRFCPKNLTESFNECARPLCSGECWNSVNDEEGHAI